MLQTGDILLKIRGIICQDFMSNLHGVNYTFYKERVEACTSVYLKATRTLNNERHIGLKFLIGTVEEFVQAKVQQSSRKSDTWVLFQDLCKDSGIGLFRIAQKDQGSVVYSIVSKGNDNNLGGNNQDMGQFVYTVNDKQNQCLVQVGSANTSTYFANVGRINDKYCVYVQLLKVSEEYITPITFKILEAVQHMEAIEHFNSIATEDYATSKVDTFFKLIKPIIKRFTENPNPKRKPNLTPSPNPKKLMDLMEFDNIKRFGSSRIFGKQINFMWFKNNEFDDNDKIDGYLPTTIHNSATRKLNFLVWYSDADRNGFMRHAAILENDVLSSRLRRHAKMLVYCEDDERQEKYSEMLFTVLQSIKNEKASTATNKYEDLRLQLNELKRVESKKTIFTVIPAINEYFYRENVISGSSGIRNAFCNKKDLELCVRSILGVKL